MEPDEPDNFREETTQAVAVEEPDDPVETSRSSLENSRTSEPLRSQEEREALRESEEATLPETESPELLAIQEPTKSFTFKDQSKPWQSIRRPDFQSSP